MAKFRKKPVAPKCEPVDVEQLRDLCSRATPPPWELSQPAAGFATLNDFKGSIVFAIAYPSLGIDPPEKLRPSSECEANARLIAAARAALPACLHEIKDLRAALKLLSDCYDEQTEEQYCICASNDLGEHSAVCIRHMHALDAVSAALRGEPKEGM